MRLFQMCTLHQHIYPVINSCWWRCWYGHIMDSGSGGSDIQLLLDLSMTVSPVGGKQNGWPVLNLSDASMPIKQQSVSQNIKEQWMSSHNGSESIHWKVSKGFLAQRRNCKFRRHKKQALWNDSAHLCISPHVWMAAWRWQSWGR